jgi:hypothetical protein
MEIKKIILNTVISFSLLGTTSHAFADTCPGSEGVFKYSGSLPTNWENSTKETISNGEHNFLQVTWKTPDGSANGTVYCTYSGSLVLASTNTSVPRPSSATWKASSIANALNCTKGIKDCDFTSGTSDVNTTPNSDTN